MIFNKIKNFMLLYGTTVSITLLSVAQCVTTVEIYNLKQKLKDLEQTKDDTGHTY